MNMETGKALDVMMEILPDIAVIMNDKEADEIFAKYRGKDWLQSETGDAMQDLMPLFARKYRAELLRIVAAFEGCTPEEVVKLDISKTISALAYGLKTTTGFFTCCLHMARNM